MLCVQADVRATRSGLVPFVPVYLKYRISDDGKTVQSALWPDDDDWEDIEIFLSFQRSEKREVYYLG